eukprot:5566709-Pleurochrysis_carterae.AAC.1
MVTNLQDPTECTLVVIDFGYAGCERASPFARLTCFFFLRVVCVQDIDKQAHETRSQPLTLRWHCSKPHLFSLYGNQSSRLFVVHLASEPRYTSGGLC